MINIALYGSNELLLDELQLKLSEGLRFTGYEFFRIEKLSFFQTSLFENMYDLFIIDITENAEKNLQFAQELHMNPSLEMIFIASKPSFAMDAYDLDGLAYLLSPVDYTRLNQIILRRFASSMNKDDKSFSFKTSEGIKIIPANRITYIEYSNHRMNIHLDTGKTVSTSTMRLSFSNAAAELLDDKRFVRSHASFIVNVAHVVEFGSSFITLDSGDRVPVSHAKHSSVKAHVINYYSHS